MAKQTYRSALEERVNREFRRLQIGQPKTQITVQDCIDALKGKIKTLPEIREMQNVIRRMKTLKTEHPALYKKVERGKLTLRDAEKRAKEHDSQQDRPEHKSKHKSASRSRSKRMTISRKRPKEAAKKIVKKFGTDWSQQLRKYLDREEIKRMGNEQAKDARRTSKK